MLSEADKMKTVKSESCGVKKLMSNQAPLQNAKKVKVWDIIMLDTCTVLTH